MYLSAGNVLRNPAVGMLFIDFVKGQPVPNWKRSDWARDVLAADDPARDPNATVV
jgi:hypothetical protein